MNAGARFSECRTWRYTLWRRWDDALPWVNFIGLNPSTADETDDDPTIRRCIGFARRWGYGGIVMTNIFAFRATDPKDMKAADDPVGPMNDHFLYVEHLESDRSVACWGVHGKFQNRGSEVLAKLLPFKAWCLGTTKDGQPKHPLYLRADTEPTLF